MSNYQVLHGRVVDQNGNVGILYSPSAGYIQDKTSYCSDNDSVDGLYDDRSVWSTDPETGANDAAKLFCPPLVLHLANGGKVGELLGKDFEKYHQTLSKKGKLILNGALPNLDALDRVTLAWIPANSRFKVSIKANEDGGLEEYIEYYDPNKWHNT
jgi:hypothetical protein